MAHEIEVPGPSSETAPGQPGEAEKPHQFGLPAAMALIVGSVIGVGIFNLPTSLAAYGPITLVSMALTTVGALALALLFAALPGAGKTARAKEFWVAGGERGPGELGFWRGGCRLTAGRTPTPGWRSATG